MNRKSKTMLAAAILGAAVLGLIVYSTLSLGGYSCEVCMEYEGQGKCRSAKGSSEDEARKTAVDNACAYLTSGVTGSIACTNTPPKSVRCQKGS